MKMNPYNMPQIIKETSDGYFHLSVLDDLLSQGKSTASEK